MRMPRFCSKPIKTYMSYKTYNLVAVILPLPN